MRVRVCVYAYVCACVVVRLYVCALLDVWVRASGTTGPLRGARVCVGACFVGFCVCVWLCFSLLHTLDDDGGLGGEDNGFSGALVENGLRRSPAEHVVADKTSVHVQAIMCVGA